MTTTPNDEREAAKIIRDTYRVTEPNGVTWVDTVNAERAARNLTAAGFTRQHPRDADGWFLSGSTHTTGKITLTVPDADHVRVSRALLREAADVADLFNAGHDPNCGDLPARLREAAGEGEG